MAFLIDNTYSLFLYTFVKAQQFQWFLTFKLAHAGKSLVGISLLVFSDPSVLAL